MLYLLLTIIVLLFSLTVVFILFVDSANFIRNQAPFVPSTKSAIRDMLSIVDLRGNERIADLGSGDGRVVREFAQRGFETTGYEINHFLVLLSRILLKSKKLNNSKILRKNFLKADLSSYDVLVVYGITGIMPRLEEKLMQNIENKKVYVISNIFIFGNKNPVKQINNIRLYEF